MRRGNKVGGVEHKGIVERVGVFSLATRARSGASGVSQTALGVRPTFDAGFLVKKKPIFRAESADTRRCVSHGPNNDRTRAEQRPNEGASAQTARPLSRQA